MIGIILGILKVIGIVLLILLGLILLLLSAVLFAPVRYGLYADKEDKDIHADAKVFWLLGIIYGSVKYTGGKDYKISIRIFGIDLMKVQDFFKKRKTGKKPSFKNDSVVMQEIEEKPARILIEEKQDQKATEELESSVKKTRQEKEIVKEKVKEKQKTDFGKLFKKTWGKIKNAVTFIVHLPKRIKEKVLSLKKAVKKGIEKPREAIAFIKSEEFQGAYACAKAKIKALLKHILPRKVKGELAFGFEDPSITGQILGAAAMLYPIYGKSISLYPDFTGNRLEGYIKLKGHIRVCVILKLAWELYRDQNIKAMRKAYTRRNKNGR